MFVVRSNNEKAVGAFLEVETHRPHQLGSMEVRATVLRQVPQHLPLADRYLKGSGPTEAFQVGPFCHPAGQRDSSALTQSSRRCWKSQCSPPVTPTKQDQAATSIDWQRQRNSKTTLGLTSASPRSRPPRGHPLSRLSFLFPPTAAPPSRPEICYDYSAIDPLSRVSCVFAVSPIHAPLSRCSQDGGGRGGRGLSLDPGRRT